MSPVERSDVIGDGGDQLVPVELHLRRPHRPAERAGVLGEQAVR